MSNVARCRRCTNVVRFCPCCGAALAHIANADTQRTTARSATTSAAGSRSTTDTAPAANSFVTSLAGKAAVWVRQQKLPARPISAYELFQCAEQAKTQQQASQAQDRLQESSSAAAGVVGSESGAAASSASHGALATSKERQRAIALAWLGLTPEEKHEYEQAAQANNHAVVQSTAPCATSPHAASPVASDGVFVGSHFTASLTAAAVVSDVSSASPASLACVPASKQRTYLKKKPPAPASLPRRPSSSFNVFRAEMRGRKLSVAETATLWRRMSAEEKAPYDAAAAQKRTEVYLLARQEASGADDGRPGEGGDGDACHNALNAAEPATELPATPD